VLEKKSFHRRKITDVICANAGLNLCIGEVVDLSVSDRVLAKLLAMRIFRFGRAMDN
jgi:hypothetical protein